MGQESQGKGGKASWAEELAKGNGVEADSMKWHIKTQL